MDAESSNPAEKDGDLVRSGAREGGGLMDAESSNPAEKDGALVRSGAREEGGGLMDAESSNPAEKDGALVRTSDSHAEELEDLVRILDPRPDSGLLSSGELSGTNFVKLQTTVPDVSTVNAWDYRVTKMMKISPTIAGCVVEPHLYIQGLVSGETIKWHYTWKCGGREEVIGETFRIPPSAVEKEGLELTATPTIKGETASPLFIDTYPVKEFPETYRRNILKLGNPGTFTASTPDLRVVQYNILSKRLNKTNPSLNVWWPSEKPHLEADWPLEWPFRRELLIRELKSYDADILCLQEVEVEDYEDFFKKEFGSEYHSEYAAKDGGFGNQNNGCATFSRKSKLDCCRKTEVRYDLFANDVDDKDLGKLISSKKSLALICEFKWGNAELIVANTHLASPDLVKGKSNTAIRDFQIETLYKKLIQMRNMNTEPSPIILCGDLNSYSDSAVYNLLSGARLIADGSLELKSVYLCLKEAENIEEEIKQKLSKGGEPMFTEVNRDKRDTIDYIFFTDKFMNCTEIVEPMDMKEPKHLMKYGLPSYHWGSDHVAIVATFSWKKPGIRVSIN